MANDSIGDRMKNNYEDITRNYLLRRTPVIVRIDGKAFHTLTRVCEKPFDKELSDMMICAARAVMDEAQGSKIAYIQSDEISILLTDYDTLDTHAWFDYNIQKICSVSSSIATAVFNQQSLEKFRSLAYFDCRVFNIPREEVNNYFIWRQQDWMRNSVQMLARYYFSQKELNGKNVPAMHEMLYTKGVNWADLKPARWKNGFVIYKSGLEREDFIFKENWKLMGNIINPDAEVDGV